jgi:HD-GYP domain-containing protein (c-di-GMP phosphodiesterase class II)
LIIQWLFLYFITSLIYYLCKFYIRYRKYSVNLILALVNSLDSRDRYTSCHSHNVAVYSKLIAKEMKLPKRKCNHIYLGGLLHDIGKIGVPEAILNKPARLSAEEFNVIKQHPEIGYHMVKHIGFFRDAGILDMILHHHERYDGEGYPKQLKGDEIPRSARIVAVADAFDAMTSSRLYRKGKDIPNAIKDLMQQRGLQFDPDVVDAFLRVLDRNGTITSEKAMEISGQTVINDSSVSAATGHVVVIPSKMTEDGSGAVGGNLDLQKLSEDVSSLKIGKRVMR